MRANQLKNHKKTAQAMSIDEIKHPHHEKGISLLEVVLVLAILVILGGYALSSYRSYHQRGYRLAAITAVYEAAFYLEKMQDAGKAYAIKLPPDLARSPRQGAAAYALSMQTGNTQNGGYSIIALPLENGPMRRDKCGRYQLDATGQRNNGHTRQFIGQCWVGM